ncbi:hypothetical protein QTP88_021638 [Uroleucon formosanum]
MFADLLVFIQFLIVGILVVLWRKYGVPELKFAEQKSKSFKSYLLEITDGKLICYRDKSGSTTLYEWFVKDLIWYIGFEPKRNPHARLRDNFGWSIAGTTKEDHLRWMAALLLSEYGVDPVAPPGTGANKAAMQLASQIPNATLQPTRV